MDDDFESLVCNKRLKHEFHSNIRILEISKEMINFMLDKNQNTR